MYQNKLSILIPTRNRASELQKTVSSFIQIIKEHDYQDQVEIVISNNCSSDETKNICEDLASKYSFVKYFEQESLRNSAEESLFNAIRFTSKEYVWFFGDDDQPKTNSLAIILQKINSSPQKPAFILLNNEIYLPTENKLLSYLSRQQESYETGADLFKNFGLISATTTISCLVVQKKYFQVDSALSCIKKAHVYSHSAALLISFYNLPCMFINSPLLIYKQNSLKEEGDRFGNFCEKNGLIPESIFTSEFIKLVYYIEEKTGIFLKDILNFKEHELNKTTWELYNSRTITFILRFAIHRIDILKTNLKEFNRNDFIIIKSITKMLLRSKNYIFLFLYVSLFYNLMICRFLTTISFLDPLKNIFVYLIRKNVGLFYRILRAYDLGIK